MTKHEILKETVEYYKNNSRGLLLDEEAGTWDCVYLGKDNSMCAVGRCLEDKILEDLPTRQDSITASELATFYEDASSLDDLLKPQYRGHDIDFWGYLQMFHDDPSNWDGKTLTDKGKEEYAILFNKFEDEND